MASLPQVVNTGIDGGMNIALDATVIPPNEAEIAIDCLFDEPGIVKRRGGMLLADRIVAPGGGYNILKAFTTQRADGTIFIGMVAILTTTSFLYFITCDQNFTNFTYEQITSTGGTATPLVSVKPALGGGVWVGVSNQAEASSAPTTAGRQFLWLWKGASMISASFTQNGTPLTIGQTSFTLTTTPGVNLVGSFAFGAGGAPIGFVKSTAAGVVTLEKPAMIGNAASTTVYFRPVRGYINHYSKGRITCSTASTFVAGAGTDFTLWNNHWNIFRSSDNAYIGQVSTVTNSTSVTLAANALQNMANESYWAVASAQQWGPTGIPGNDLWLEPNTQTNPAPGWINTVHQGRQFFANRNHQPDAGGDYVSRVWVSDTQLGEAIDFNLTDGDFFQIGSGPNTTGPILDIVSLQNQLLVFKESEVWAVTGNDPSNYTTNKIFSDGLVCTMAWDLWNDGIIWIGRRGLWYYDGLSSPINLVKNSMGVKWTNFLKSFSQANTNRAWLAAVRDHAMVSVSNPVAQVVPKTTSTSSFINNGLLMPVVYIPTQALSFWTNANHSGGFQMGGVLNSRNVLVAGGAPDVNVNAWNSGLIDVSNLFAGGTVADQVVLTGRNPTASPNSTITLPQSSILCFVASLSGDGWASSGNIYVNGNPNNVITYTSISGTTFNGCSGGIGTIGSSDILTQYPLGPWFYLSSHREAAGTPILRKGWRQLSLSFKNNGGSINLYTSTNVDDVGVAPRVNPQLLTTGSTWNRERHRFGHTGTFIQWRLAQADQLSTDIRLGATDLFYVPQRPRRVK